MGMGMGMGMTNIFLLRRSISSAFSLLKARVVRAVERNHRFYSSSAEKETIGDRIRPGYPSRVPRVVPPSRVPLYNP